jgi:hypothetical protein
VIVQRIGSADYQMTAGVDSRDLPKSDPLNDLQPPGERFPDRENYAPGSKRPSPPRAWVVRTL